MMKELIIIAVILLMGVLTIHAVAAETFSSTVNISVNGTSVSLDFEGTSDAAFTTNATFTLQHTFQLQRNTTNIDYPEIERIVRNQTLAINNTCGINVTALEQTLDGVVDEDFAAQQAYMQNTLLPQVTEMEQLKSDNKITQNALDSCNVLKEGLQGAIAFRNSSEEESKKILTRQNSLLVYALGGVNLILLFGLAFFIVERFKGGRNIKL